MTAYIEKVATARNAGAEVMMEANTERRIKYDCKHMASLCRIRLTSSSKGVSQPYDFTILEALRSSLVSFTRRSVSLSCKVLYFVALVITENPIKPTMTITTNPPKKLAPIVAPNSTKANTI